MVDRWLAVSVKQGSIETEEINHFIERVGLDRNIPSKPVDNPEQYRGAVRQAVDHFQTLLVATRKERAVQVEQSLDDILDRLSSLEKQYFSQLNLKFEAVEGETLPRRRGREMRLEKQKKEISQLFDDTHHRVFGGGIQHATTTGEKAGIGNCKYHRSFGCCQGL